MNMELVKFDGYDSIIETDEQGNEVRVIYDGLDSRSASIIIGLMYEIDRLHEIVAEKAKWDADRKLLETRIAYSHLWQQYAEKLIKEKAKWDADRELLQSRIAELEKERDAAVEILDEWPRVTQLAIESLEDFLTCLQHPQEEDQMCHADVLLALANTEVSP